MRKISVYECNYEKNGEQNAQNQFAIHFCVHNVNFFLLIVPLSKLMIHNLIRIKLHNSITMFTKNQ